MKHFLFALSLFMTFNSFANNSQVENVKAAYFASSELLSTLQAIEDHFQMKCDNARVSVAFWNAKFPKRATWKGLCHNETSNFYVRIKSSFKNDGNSFSFKKKWIKITNIFTLPSDELDLISVDPFVNAYSRSETVKSFKRFTEDHYLVTCRPGKAKRGNGLNAAKFKYKTKCKSEKSKVKLAVKSKVEVISDTSFRFNLKSAKILFE